MKQEEYDMLVYEKFVQDQKEKGIWIERHEYFDKMQNDLKKKLSIQKPKSDRKISEEQLIKNKEYIKKVNSNETLFDFKTPMFESLTDDQAKIKTFDILKSISSFRNETLVFDENNKPIYNQLTKYFNRDESFEGSLSKGICLFGGVGTGKSLIMEVFKRFTAENTNKFKIHDMKDIAIDVQEHGVKVLPEYTKGICCYDDVGFENIASNYGNKICAFTDLINILYDRYLETGKVCHITTNLGFSTDLGFGLMANKYDARVVDRMRQMFNIIILKGNSKRK
jgi:DNA replication protein DnaC